MDQIKKRKEISEHCCEMLDFLTYHQFQCNLSLSLAKVVEIAHKVLPCCIFITTGKNIKFISQIEELRNGYMAKAVAYAKSTEEALVPMQHDVRQLQTEVS